MQKVEDDFVDTGLLHVTVHGNHTKHTHTHAFYHRHSFPPPHVTYLRSQRHIAFLTTPSTRLRDERPARRTGTLSKKYFTPGVMSCVESVLFRKSEHAPYIVPSPSFLYRSLSSSTPRTSCTLRRKGVVVPAVGDVVNARCWSGRCCERQERVKAGAIMQ